MCYYIDMNIELKKNNLEITSSPINDTSPEIKEAFRVKTWKSIPIDESVTENPKFLKVVPNISIPGQVMAWPAYYKTVKEGSENSNIPSGIGELAQKIEGEIQKSPIVKIRPELKLMLDEAQKVLDNNPFTSNLKLVLIDGYRRIKDQGTLFEAYHSYVKSKNPDLSEIESRSLATKMVSEPPQDPNTLIEILKDCPPPHSTGGSADVVLVFKDKIDTNSDYWVESAMVPFGAQFDEMMHPVYGDERSETTFYEKKSKESVLSKEEKEALEYRRILYHTLTKLGFTNYYTEFWHYDFGNQFNALVSGKKSAKFGFAGGINGDTVIEDWSAEKEAYKHAKSDDKVPSHFSL